MTTIICYWIHNKKDVNYNTDNLKCEGEKSAEFLCAVEVLISLK